MLRPKLNSDPGDMKCVGDEGGGEIETGVEFPVEMTRVGAAAATDGYAEAVKDALIPAGVGMGEGVVSDEDVDAAVPEVDDEMDAAIGEGAAGEAVWTLVETFSTLGRAGAGGGGIGKEDAVMDGSNVNEPCLAMLCPDVELKETTDELAGD